MKKFNSKRFIAGISSLCIAASALPFTAAAVTLTASAAQAGYGNGDANEDTKVNMADAVAILQNLANSEKYPLSATGSENADCDGSAGLTGSDAIFVQRCDAGEITLPLPGGETDPDPVTDIVYIHLNDTGISVEGDNNGYTSVSGTTVTINHSGSYYVDGTLSDGQINVNVPDEVADPETVKIFLNGVNITGATDSAILITNAENTSINLVDGTTNTISDGETAYASGAAVIEAKDDLTIKGGDAGTGILNLTANVQDGIVCNNDLKVTGGVVNVTTLNSTSGSKTNGLNGKTSLTVKGGEVNVDATSDGIKSGSGNVDISGGTITVKAGADAVQAETTIDISGGTLIAGGDRGLTAVTAVNITGGTVVATATDNQAAGVTAANQAAILLNCIDDASNTDLCWKKANSIAAGSVSETFTKKYKYVLISDASITAGQTYTLTNTSTGAVVTHTNDTAESFTVTNSVTTFDTVNPAGKDGGAVVVDPVEGTGITLSGATITSDYSTDLVTVANGVATITQPGVYDITGTGSEVQIVVDVDKTAYPDAEVELDLNNVNLTNTSTSPIYVNSCGGECIIVAKNGTENTISDGTNYTNADADQGAIYSKDDLKFKGKGKLTVNGNANDAIVGKDDVKIFNGTLVVNAVDDGIRGKDSVKIGDDSKADGSEIDYSNLKVTVNTQISSTGGGDGIKSTNDTDEGKGYVEINGGTVEVKAYADGIQAQQEFRLNGGDVNIYTSQGSSYTSSGSSTTQPTDPGQQWAPGGGGGGFNPGGGGMEDGNSNKTDISAKGIKAVGIYDSTGTTYQSMGNLIISGGTLVVDSSDDALHCGGDMTVTGGVMTLSSADDGMHSDHSLTIGTQGSGKLDDVQIYIPKCYEGVEGVTINQNSGTVYIVSGDDGYNAAGGADGSGSGNGSQFGGGMMSTSSGTLYLNGGFVVVNSANGDHDAFDSNGNFNMSGGYYLANGQEPMDYDGSFNRTGGSYATMTSGNTNLSTRYTFKDSSGNVIVSFISASGSPSSTLDSGVSFTTGGTVSGGTAIITQSPYETYIGGTISGDSAVSGSGSGGFNPWG